MYFPDIESDKCNEDKEIEKVKKQMNRTISDLKNKYGDTTVYPNIKYILCQA
jgi:hypothetical protein